MTAVALLVVGLALVAAVPPNDPPNRECDPNQSANLKSNNHGKLSAAMKLCIESKLHDVASGILARFGDAKHNGVDRTHRWDGTLKVYTNGPKAKFQKWNADKAGFDTYVRGFTDGREMWWALTETVALEKVPPTISTRDLTNKLKAVLADSLTLSSAIDATGLTGMDVAYNADAKKADRFGAYRLAGLSTIYPKIQQVLDWVITQNTLPNLPAALPDAPTWANSDAKYQTGEKEGWGVAHAVPGARRYSTSNGKGNYFVLNAAQSATHGEKCMECPILGTTKVLDITGDNAASLQTRKDLIAAGILNDGAGNPRTNPNQYNIWPKPDLTELVMKQIKVLVAFRAASNVGPEAGPYLNDKGALDFTGCTVQGGVNFRQLFKKQPRVLQEADV